MTYFYENAMHDKNLTTIAHMRNRLKGVWEAFAWGECIELKAGHASYARVSLHTFLILFDEGTSSVGTHFKVSKIAYIDYMVMQHKMQDMQRRVWNANLNYLWRGCY